MDLTASAPKYFQPPPPPPPPPPLFTSTDNVVVMQEAAALESINNSTGLMYGRSKNNPLAETFQDPLCKLNLKETAEFVKSLPMGNSSSSIECRGFLELPVPPPSQNQIQNQRRAAAAAERRMEAPPTPGRPLFSFSVAKKNFPSKWDDAEKWLISSSCNGSPAHPVMPPPPDSLKIHKQIEVFAEKSRVTQEKVLLKGLEQHNSLAKAFNVPQEVLLKDKFTDNSEPVLPSYRYSEPSKEGFLFRERASEGMKDASTAVIHEVKHRDIGTDMTPLGSSTTSRCHTPFKITSPARHNTPADRSGPLALDNSSSSKNLIDISQLQECHLAKLQLGTQYDSVASNWSSKEEEEEEISKSLRHFEMSNVARKSISDSRAAAWEEEEKTKCCLRYQREEAKIQAWVNLESAKAEAQSRKLEVKIQKMRSNLEEKLMKRMAVVHRKAEEWRATARYQHSEHVNKAGEQAKKMANQHTMQLSWHTSCGCFPCSNHLI